MKLSSAMTSVNSRCLSSMVVALRFYDDVDDFLEFNSIDVVGKCV